MDISNSNLFDPKAVLKFWVNLPIFYQHGEIWGYELLFRSGPNYDTASIKDEDLATFSVATSGFIKSQEDLDQTKKICINFPESLLKQGAPNGLPPAVTVIEVLENVSPSDQLIEALIGYKQEGYQIAIDDYEGRKGHNCGPEHHLQVIEVSEQCRIRFLN
jgi:EAL and modified HD-GYP domain-containing signal transduction protein